MVKRRQTRLCSRGLHRMVIGSGRCAECRRDYNRSYFADRYASDKKFRAMRRRVSSRGTRSAAGKL